MNAQDKAEALLLANAVVMGTDDEGRLTADSIKAALDLRALIERQPDDTDGKRWRFCAVNGFPRVDPDTGWWRCWGGSEAMTGKTPNEVADAAMAAMKEKA